MPLEAEVLRDVVLNHLLEVASGHCSISDDTIESCSEPDLREILTGILMLHEDLQYQTERGELAAQLTHRNAQINSIVDNAPVALALCDAYFNVQWANEPMASMLGDPLPVIRRGRWTTHAQALHGGLPQLDSVLDGAPLDFFGLRIDGAGGDRFFDVHYRRVQTEHSGVPGGSRKIQGVLVIGHEITVRKHQENALREKAAELERLNASLLRANDDLEQFANIASHDLRAPLRAISDVATLIAQDIGPDSPGDTHRMLGLLAKRAARMELLVANLLEYTRAGRGDATLVSVDVVQLVAEIMDDLSVVEGLRVHIEDGLPTLHTARAPLRQVLANLIQNARKHHDGSQCNVWVRACEDGDVWRFRVSDDGPGIPSHQQAIVWKMFRTLAPTSSGDGAGMGMALIKKLVEDAGGAVSLTSPIEDERGLAVTFTWPRVWPHNRSAPHDG